VDLPAPENGHRNARANARESAVFVPAGAFRAMRPSPSLVVQVAIERLRYFFVN
jgi:hypothetical protein